MSLKESLIQQTEQAVDGLRKRRVTLEAELEVICAEEKEAREMLQFLRNGKVTQPTKASRMSFEDVAAIVEELPDTFNNNELADALGVKSSTASGRGKQLAQRGIVRITFQGQLGQKEPTVYEKVSL